MKPRTRRTAWTLLLACAVASTLAEPSAAGPSPACVTVGPRIPPAYVGVDPLYCAQIAIDDANFVVHCAEENTCIGFGERLVCDVFAIVSPTLPCAVLAVQAGDVGARAAPRFHECSHLQAYPFPSASPNPQACYDEAYGTACRDAQWVAPYVYCGPTDAATSLS